MNRQQLDKLFDRLIVLLKKGRTLFAPFEVSLVECFLVRLGVALVVWHLFPLATFPSEDVPNGIAQLPFVSFTWLNNPGMNTLLGQILLVALVCYVLNRLLFIALPTISFILIAAGTHTNSQSAEVTHHSQIVALLVLVQTVWYFVHLRKRRKSGQKWTPSARLDWGKLAVYFSIQAIIASYMVSVVSKWQLSDGDWFANAANAPIQFVKNDLADYYNQVGRPTADVQSIDGETFLERLPHHAVKFFIDHPNPGRLILTAGLLLELFVFISLINRRIALAYGLALIAFHLSISEIMNLNFRYHIYMLLIFLVSIPYWLSLLIPRNWRNPGLANNHPNHPSARQPEPSQLSC